MSKVIAEIIIPGLPTSLYYSLNGLEARFGDEARVQVGNRWATGWIVNLLSEAEAQKRLAELKKISKKENSEIKLKEIQNCKKVMSSIDFSLYKWMSEYYGVPLAEIIDNAIPKQQALRLQKKIFLTDDGRTFVNDTINFEKFKRRSPKQADILQKLFDEEQLLPVSSQMLSMLVEKGLIQVEQVLDIVQEIERRQDIAFTSSELNSLSAHQKNALEFLEQKINTRKFSSSLLFGVTGSGKTEVYINAILKTVALGKSALVIVPEIALTPQLLDNFKSRLNMPIAVLHSKVGTALRWETWQGILDGKIQVAIGVRSAIFAPFENLGLIIVDEEHDASYKQNSSVYYHGRDVAVMKAKFCDCPIVLGSATPSFESWLNVKNKNYHLLELPERVTGRALPKIEIVDLNQIAKNELPSENISPQLKQEIEDNLSKGEQCILLYNRRGFASYLQCDSCGTVLQCPNCSVSLTYHKKDNHLVCHYCNYERVAETHCNICRNDDFTRIEHNNLTKQEKLEKKIGLLRQRGGGTEKIFEELQKLFPQARIARLDRDTATKKDSYKNILSNMRCGEADILIGTQMIAKGHDLPNVTLVGVIDADVGLHFPDFRANERVFQTLLQASGRAGRAKKEGRVIIQTRLPQHSVIEAVQKNDFRSFANAELKFREVLKYPPFGRLLRVIISGTDLALTENYAGKLKEIVTLCSNIAKQAKAIEVPRENETSAKLYDFVILGHAPAPIQKIDNLFRFHFLIKCQSAKTLSHIAGSLSAYHEQNRQKLNRKENTMRVVLDVDPLDML